MTEEILNEIGFLKIELLNFECGLSESAAYLSALTVTVNNPNLGHFLVPLTKHRHCKTANLPGLIGCDSIIFFLGRKNITSMLLSNHICRGACITNLSWPFFFFCVQMSSFGCDLGLNGKTSPHHFFPYFVFSFREITHAKLQVFLNQPWQQMHTFADSIVWKNKSLFGKDATRKETVFLRTLFVENKRETSKQK